MRNYPRMKRNQQSQTMFRQGAKTWIVSGEKGGFSQSIEYPTVTEAKRAMAKF